MSILSGLDKLCGGAELAQAAQPPPTQAAQPAPNSVGPCAAIAAACKQAGFVPNGVKAGAGIVVDCIRPIMVGKQLQGTKPLPQIDPQVVAACKQKNPNFGMGGGGQPATKPSGT